MSEAQDKPIVYGARCTWWDTIDKAGRTLPKSKDGISLPCCPHCGNVLFEFGSREKWDAAVDKVAQRSPNYKKLMEWMQGRCYPDINAAVAAYNQTHEPITL